MSNIPNSSSKIQTESVQYQAPVSESSLTSIGAAVNYCLDGTATNSSAISGINSTISGINGTLSSLQSQINNLNRLRVNGVIANNFTASGWTLTVANRYFIGRCHVTSIGGANTVYILNRYGEAHPVVGKDPINPAGSSDAVVYLEPGDKIYGDTGGFNLVGLLIDSVSGP